MHDELTVQAAIAAYTTAAAWLYAVPTNAVANPGHVQAKATTAGTFAIHNPVARDEPGRLLPDTAICTYNADAQEWVVQFPDDQIVKLRATDGELAIVTE